MKNKKIYFWPNWFYQALSPRPVKIEPRIINRLGLANLYLWRALNIYDDFLDGHGQPAKLPLANRYYREFLEIYYRLDLSDNFYKIFKFILADLDRANRQEISARRLLIKNNKILLPEALPEPTNPLKLSRKSLALGLGPIAIISQIPDKNKEAKINLTINLFRHILAAKQLADDARDWLDDLKAGQITLANLPILSQAKKRNLTLDFKNQPELFYLLFARYSSPKICVQLEKLIKTTKNISRSLGLKANNQLLTEIIKPIEIGLKEVRRFRSKLSRLV
ncbi:MAG: hypothetical protein WC863_02915 [Patescibacteria group bacterium]